MLCKQSSIVTLYWPVIISRSLTWCSQSRERIGMPRPRAHRNLTVLRIRSVTRWDASATELARLPPRASTVRSPRASTTPVKSTCGWGWAELVTTTRTHLPNPLGLLPSSHTYSDKAPCPFPPTLGAVDSLSLVRRRLRPGIPSGSSSVWSLFLFPGPVITTSWD